MSNNSIWSNTLTDSHVDDAPSWDDIKRQDYERPARHEIHTDQRHYEQDYPPGPTYYDNDPVVPNTASAPSREILAGKKSYINAGIGIAYGLASVAGVMPEGMGLGTAEAIGLIWFGVQSIFMRMGMGKPPKLVELGAKMGLRTLAKRRRRR